jgi:threonyl-tRNA synthetase
MSDQFSILPISEKFNSYAQKVSDLLNNSDIRGFVDDRNEKIGKKIRESEIGKIPFMLIVGEQEATNEEVAVRQRLEGDLGTMKIEELANFVNKKIEDELAFND